MIEIFDYNNYPMHYTKYALEYMENGTPLPDSVSRAIYKMRCRGCGTDYPIRWDREFPFPLFDDGKLERLFLSLYKEEYDNTHKSIKDYLGDI